MKEMVGGCCVCSDERGWDENPLVYCDGRGCNVAVHQACYGIVTVPVGSWYCRKCESQERAARVRCELCPQREGALKRTDNGSWCHVICALFIPEAWFGDTATMEPIILSRIPVDRYNKSCYICEELSREGKATTGACMQCNRAGCKQHFHVTCAQGQGLLCEVPRSTKDDNVKYIGYCSYHYKKMKKDGNMKVYSAYKPMVLDNETDTTPSVLEKAVAASGRQDKSKSRTSSQSSSSTPATLSQSVTLSKIEGKEKNQTKNSTQNPPVSSSESVSGYKSPPTLSVVSTIAETTAAKTTAGKFTTANFIETTIQPSPANFGSVGGVVTTAVTSVLSTASTTTAVPSTVASVTAASESVARSPTLSYSLKTATTLPSTSPGSSSFAAKSSPSTTTTTTSSAATFSNTFQNFVGQNYTFQLEASSSDLPTLSSPELPRGKKRQKKATDSGGKGSKKGKTDRDAGGKGKAAKTLSDGPSSAMPPTLSPVYSSAVVPPAPRKSETKRAISNIISSLSPKSNDEDVAAPASHTAVTTASAHVHQERKSPIDMSSARLVGPPAPPVWSASATATSNTVGQMPTTMEQLLEHQWEQGSEFLMKQGQHFDIASLLSCLYQLKAENHTLEERIATMTARRDRLLAVNARLSVPLASPGSNSYVADPDAQPNSLDNGLMDDGASRHGKSPRPSAAPVSNSTSLREAGDSHHSVVGGQNTSIVTSSPMGLPAVPNISLLQPSMLSASLLPGGAGVLPPASNTATAMQLSPGKKARGAAAISAPSTTTISPMFPVPMMPNAVQHSLTAPGALSYFPRPSESLEQIQRNQLLQRQMLIAAGQQLTPEQQSLLLSMTQPRLNVLGSSPTVAGVTASVSMATPPHHQRTPPTSANPGYHGDKTSGVRKEKSL